MESLTRREIVPAYPAPPGVTANFVNPDFIGTRLIIVCAVFSFLTVVCVVLRLYVRLRITKAFGIDDCKQPTRPCVPSN